MDEHKQAFTEREAAHYIGMSRSFLRQSRQDGVRANRTPGPPFVKVGRAIRYLVMDLDQWLLQHRQEPPNENDGAPSPGAGSQSDGPASLPAAAAVRWRGRTTARKRTAP
jgi:hypothetical protein